ncbi:hypothetical protein [uncultured Methylobacterium sp.]|uniref:hypothetical protein n=1 Tax=uncultured Methylobacterium sp. TaxID=157278 RepID=UPI0035CB1AD4
MSTTQTAQLQRSRAKVEGTYISEGTHPHVFAAYPALRERAAEGGGMVLMSAATLTEFERQSGPKPSGSSSPPSSSRSSSSGCDPEITKTFSPAALDQMRGGPPKTEMSAADLDAHFERSRAARAARRRH